MPGVGTHTAFWDDARTQIVLEALKDVAKTLGQSPEVLTSFLVTLAPGAVLPDATGLRRLLRGATARPKNLNRLLGIMQALEALYELEQNRTFRPEPQNALKALAGEYRRVAQAAALAAGSNAVGSPDPAMFVRTLADLLKIDFSAVKQSFFADHDQADQPLYYLMYRFDTVPSRVLKSHLTLRPPCGDQSACTFQHTAKVTDQFSYRRTAGLVMPFGHTLSFVGQMTDGPGLKVMTLTMPASARQRYNGLLLSFDEKHTPLSSRFVMVRTAFADPADAGIGVFPEQKLATEIASFKSEMRNEIPCVDQQIFNHGKPLTQHQFLELVDTRLREAGDDLTDQTGQPFTPMATFAAAYNAALRIVTD